MRGVTGARGSYFAAGRVATIALHQPVANLDSLLHRKSGSHSSMVLWSSGDATLQRWALTRVVATRRRETSNLMGHLR